MLCIIEETKEPLNNEDIVTHCLDIDKVSKILGYNPLFYKIQWFNGNWSEWYKYGNSDSYQKDNEPPRRYIACFNDHRYKVVGITE